jgi:molecular chaperone HscC
MFGRFPATDINPDEVVALGAAVQAGLKMKDAALKEVVMTDVSPYSLGVEVSMTSNDQVIAPGYFDPVIERNSPIPISRVKRYFPVRDRQSHIELEIYQGEARMVADNIHLGGLRLPVPIAKRQDSGVDVRFTYDVNGILQVEATVLKTSQTFSVIIQGNPGMLSDAEIAERLKALSELKIHPRDRMEHRTLLARAERIYQVMRGESRERFGRQILEYEKLLDRQDMRAIEPVRQKFEHVVDEIERDSYVGAIDHDPMF